MNSVKTATTTPPYTIKQSHLGMVASKEFFSMRQLSVPTQMKATLALITEYPSFPLLQLSGDIV